MKYGGRRQRLYPVKQEPELPDDILIRVSRHDQNISAGVIVMAGNQPVLMRVGAEANDRDPAPQGVVDLTGIGPSQRRNDKPGPVEEAAAGKIFP